MSFFAAVAPCGSELPEESEVSLGGMSVTIQCVNVPLGASGSSTRIAMLLVLAGTFDHDDGPPSIRPLCDHDDPVARQEDRRHGRSLDRDA